MGGCPRGAKCKYKHPDLKLSRTMKTTRTLNESVEMESTKPKIKILVDKYKLNYCKDIRKLDCKYGENC